VGEVTLLTGLVVALDVAARVALPHLNSPSLNFLLRFLRNSFDRPRAISYSSTVKSMRVKTAAAAVPPRVCSTVNTSPTLTRRLIGVAGRIPCTHTFTAVNATPMLAKTVCLCGSFVFWTVCPGALWFTPVRTYPDPAPACPATTPEMDRRMPSFNTVMVAMTAPLLVLEAKAW